MDRNVVSRITEWIGKKFNIIIGTNQTRIGFFIFGVFFCIIIGFISTFLPNVTTSHTVLGEINIALILSIGFFLLLNIITFCEYRQGKWIVPSCLVFFVLMIILSSYLYLLFVYKEQPRNPGDIISAVGLILGFFGVVGTFFGLFFARKIERLLEFGKRVDDVSSMTVTSAELAFSILPDFTETHHIPARSYNALRKICEHVFQPGSQILAYLDEIGNGATLRYARGLKSFAEDDYKCAIITFEEVLGCKEVKSEIKNSAYYWLGITYRQERQYKEAIGYFKKMFENAEHNSKEIIQAKYGIALTLNAIYKDYKEYIERSSDKDKIEKQIENDVALIMENGLVTLRHRESYNIFAYKLINDVIKDQPNNYSAILYQAKTYLENEGKVFLDNPGTGTERKIRINLKILLKFLERKMPESINILANYLVVEALCYLYLNENIENAKGILEHAYRTASKYNNTIFSDIKVRQIRTSEFMKEIEELSNEYVLNCSFLSP